VSESFSTLPLQKQLGAYCYQQYADDPNIQAFFAAYNNIAQGYLDWFNNTPLGVYTSPAIAGPLLDWVGEGVYGIARPVLTSSVITKIAGYNSAPYNTVPYNGMLFSETGTAAVATDDIYKRVLTWHLYRGDGQQFSIFWLKNRINRFLNGVNGADWPVLNNPPSITISGNTFTISASASSIFSTLQQAIENGILALPFQYNFIVANYLSNDGGVLQVAAAAGYPTSNAGLATGALWSNGGVVCVTGTTTPNPAAPPVYFSSISAGQLLSLGGANLPTSNPGVGSGQLWNNIGTTGGTGGVVCIA